jgi:hypothetical protein
MQTQQNAENWYSEFSKYLLDVYMKFPNESVLWKDISLHTSRELTHERGQRRFFHETVAP